MKQSSPKNPQIQALRAIAALLVLIYHADLVPGGYIGVDIFYVISGFLITGLLVRELERTKGIALAAFYARRFRRLLPSSLIVIFSTGVVAWLLFPISMRQTLGKDLIAASTYISNFLFALWNNDYQNLNSTPSPFIHFWSLAVEEQFYLFWPLTLLAIYKLGGRRALVAGIALIGGISFAFSLFLTSASPIWSFYIIPTRAWELAIGGLIFFLPVERFSKPQIGFIGLLLILYATLRFNEQTAFPGTAALFPVIGTALLILSVRRWPPFLNYMALKPFVQWLGEISYPLYLWHWPALVIPSIYWSRPLRLWERSLLLALTVILAGLTHKYLEEPIRYRTWSQRRTFSFAAIATALMVLLGGSIYSSYSNTITIGGGGKYSLEEIKAKSINYYDGCHIGLGTTLSPLCEYGDRSSQETIVLYGDSHAAQWLPALDLIGRENKIKIVSLTKSACPSAEVIKEVDGQYAIDDCQAFRDSSVARIARIKPIAVLMTGMQPANKPYSKADGLSWWLAGESKAYQRIKNLTQYPIYISDTPLPHHEIPDCLASGLGDICDDTTPVNSKVASGLIPINPTPWLCDRICPAVIDGIVTYRDHSHLTNAMSEHLAPRLLSALIDIGAVSRK